MEFAQQLADAHSTKCELAAQVLISSGKLRLGVMGWSMLPSIWPGDTLFFERMTGEAVAEGDIVLYRRDSRFIIHRVLGKTAEDSMILTRGDALSQSDPLVKNHDVLGKVVFIVRDSKLIRPNKTLTFSSRALVALLQRSATANRVLIGVHGMLKKLQPPNSHDRAVPCQS
jgi:signal peptidase I